MTYKNMQVGDVVQKGEHAEDPYVIKSFEDGNVWLHRTQDGADRVWRPHTAGSIQLHPWAGALDLDIAAGDDLTPDWTVIEVKTADGRMRLKNRHNGEPTNWMDVRLGRLPEKVWLILAVAGWQQEYELSQLREGTVVKRRTMSVVDFYPYGVVVGEPQRKGYWVEARVMFANETFPCLAEELDVVADSLTKFSDNLRRDRELQEQSIRERDEELESYKRTVGEVVAVHAAENNWEGVSELYDALEVDPPNPRVEFELTVKVRLLATRTGGDPGDELKKSFLANSFSAGLVHGDAAEGFNVWADGDLKDVEIVAGSATFEVDHIEEAK